MISKEQIAHDLTMVYLINRYGISVNGDFSINDGSGFGNFHTNHFPDASEPKYVKVGTGQKGFLGLEKKDKVKSGNKVDDLFMEMVSNYNNAYEHFYRLLNNEET